MIELRTLRGAVDDEETSWIVDLYGPVDSKYADPLFVRHQFTRNPFGWSLHVFALEDGRPVGHCALLPMPARLGGAAAVAGKFEAFAVRPDRQSSTLVDGRFVGLGILDELYAQAPEAGFVVVHDLVQPDLGLLHRLHGAHGVSVPWRTFVGVGDRHALAGLGDARTIAGYAMASLQQGLRMVAAPLSARAVIRTAERGDELPRTQDHLAPGEWTIDAADMWDWLLGTGLLAWVEEPSGGRALVRLPGPARQAAELLEWYPGRRPLSGALATISAVARLGREGRSVRIGNPSGDPHLRLAARLLGFLAAREHLTIYVKSLRQDLDAADVSITPYFFATF